MTRSYYADVPQYNGKRGYFTTMQASSTLLHVTSKMRKFKPEDAGKLNFYLSAVDDLLRHPDDQPTIGIVLCKTKDHVAAEYALRDIKKPMGISEFRWTEALPEQLKGSLPTIEDLETELLQAEEQQESPK